MKLLSAEEMRRLDDLAQNQHGLDGSDLMAEAGRAIALEVERSYKPDRICIVCGKGSNAGDGFVVARQFHQLGREVVVVALEPGDSYSGAAKDAWQKLKNTSISVVSREKLSTVLQRSNVVVDAILGTGIKGEVRAEYASVIQEINDSGQPVVAADVPSGLRDLAAGEELGAVVRANVTVTIGLPKTMLLTYPGAAFTGRLVVAKINFPGELLAADEWKLNWASRAEVAEWLPERKPDSNKGTYGNVGVIAGSHSYAGATILLARAALRAGCGLATIYTLPELNHIFKIALPESTSVLLEGGSGGTWDSTAAESFSRNQKNNAVLAVGPGFGTEAGTKEFFSKLLDSWSGPMVIDADGLNLLSEGLLEKIQNREDCILTPHPGEMGRLTGTDAKAVQADRIGVARKFAVDNGVILLLKGTGTVIARPDGQVWLVSGAESALAKGGTGDVLTGAIASLFAQGMPMWQAAITAATAHLDAGSLCARRTGARGVLASEVADALSVALDRL